MVFYDYLEPDALITTIGHAPTSAYERVRYRMRLHSLGIYFVMAFEEIS